MVATHEFVLLHRTAGAAEFQPLAVPAPPSYLLTNPRRRPRLSRRRPRAPRVVVLEPVAMHKQRFLLMLVPPGGEVHHNGRPATPVTLLRVRDEVNVDGQRFFVSASRGAGVSAPEPRHVGATCPFCRLRVEADSRVFECACGTVLHCEDDRWPEARRLPCAEMSSACPNCERAIEFEEGLEWEPTP